jgi:ligand-binding sensor domain-containing protein
VVFYDGSRWRHPDATGDAPHQDEYPDVTAVAAGPDGTLWAAAAGDIFRLEENQWTRFSWPEHWVETLAVGPDGIVWVDDDGLGRFDPSTGAWDAHTPSDGLIHHQVNAIYVTSDGTVWIGTDGGVSSFILVEE